MYLLTNLVSGGTIYASFLSTNCLSLPLQRSTKGRNYLFIEACLFLYSFSKFLFIIVRFITREKGNGRWPIVYPARTMPWQSLLLWIFLQIGVNWEKFLIRAQPRGSDQQSNKKDEKESRKHRSGCPLRQKSQPPAIYRPHRRSFDPAHPAWYIITLLKSLHKYSQHPQPGDCDEIGQKSGGKVPFTLIFRMIKNKRVKKNWSEEDLKILVWVVSKYCQYHGISAVKESMVHSTIIA